ncbi:hypothetical protein SAY87_028978 [Trapa incisa]|uniref:Uncharacterized protein n=1 Tax=Trapa incisa TaxID=236973 RepID=A0AAN7QP96_9MYRT|nr:hypothetical protein SAY87_028978 [Trapa incisa]
MSGNVEKARCSVESQQPATIVAVPTPANKQKNEQSWNTKQKEMTRLCWSLYSPKGHPSNELNLCGCIFPPLCLHLVSKRSTDHYELSEFDHLQSIGSHRNMSDLGYSRCSSRRGFRLHPGKRLSVKTLRQRFVCLIRLLGRLSRPYRKALQALRRGICQESRPNSSVPRRGKRDVGFSGSNRKPLVKEMNYYVRSNSFYAEAIKDCLEFIKRNSVSADEKTTQLTDRVRPGTGHQPLNDEVSSNTVLLSKIV